ncbi:MAG: hypothetical protein WD851_15725 [Pirellulales bacterium]
MDFSRALSAMLCSLLFAACAAAQELPKIEPLLPDLESPVAMAVRPGGNAERHELFVADNTGRIVRIGSDALDQPQEMVASGGSAPIAMLFLNSKTFLTASGEAPPVLRAYEISEDGKPLSSAQTKYEVHGAAGVRGTATAMTLGPTALYLTTAGDDAAGLLRSRVRSSVPGDLKPFGQIGARPTCVAISTRGWVVVGDAGRHDESEDSRLTFHHPTDSTADPALEIAPGLLDIVAIAYSPQESLFAADFAEADPERSGIYRIDMVFQENSIGGKAVRIASIDRPTAMTFAPDGKLYVLATTKENDATRLLRVTRTLSETEVLSPTSDP